MANPQAEEGHIDIANEVAEALARIRLSGEENQVLWVIIRKTWGWHKKVDYIALSQFMDATGIKKPNVIRAIHKLLSKKIIIVIKKDNGSIQGYKFNKDYDQWQPLSKKITSVIKKDNESLSKKITSVIKKDNESLSKKIPTKENYTKENYTKEKKSPIDFFAKEKKKISEKFDDQTIQDLKLLLEWYTIHFPDFNIWGFIQKNIEKHPKAFLVTFKRVRESLERGNPIKTNIRAILQSVLNGESKHFHEADNIQAHEQRKTEWAKLYPRVGGGGDYGSDTG